LSYELSIFNDTLSMWQSVIGEDGQFSQSNTFTYAQGIKKGDVYQFRYLARNNNGPGSWSDTSYIIAA